MGVVRKPFAPPAGIVETSVYRRVAEAVNYTLTVRYPSVIRGPAGIGKTTALTSLNCKDQNIVLINATGMLKGVWQTMQEIANGLEITVYGRARPEQYSCIMRGAERCAAEGKYLIIDEAHRLNTDTVREIFDLWENHGLPIVLCGNNEVAKKTRMHAAAFDQISTRIGKEVRLTASEPHDFMMLGVERNVEGKDAYDAVIQFGMKTSMREVAQLLDAARVAAGERGSIRLEHIRTAADYSFGPKRSKQILTA
ncbi:MAG: AAA family ATPase [Rhizobiaceae bacterium]|nr:AAA family ATPase [Rhizobiaceae bacterium]